MKNPLLKSENLMDLQLIYPLASGLINQKMRS